MDCTFKVGDKVVCVDNNSLGAKRPSDMIIPEVGEVYTIRSIEDLGPFGVGCWLEEIVNRPCMTLLGFMEPGFYPIRFRPVVQRGTEKGMSILRDILNKADKPARVEA